MRNLHLIVLLFLIRPAVFAQGEKPAYKTIATTFESLYNRNSYDSIFNLFSAEMKKALPLDKNTAFFTELKSSAGQIISRHFERYQSPFAVYKTTCERQVLSLNVALDARFKISGFFIQPYTPQLPVPERNTTALKLPFREAWTVFWGGDTRAQNYHVDVAVQKNAFDFLITDSAGKTHKGDGNINDDYYAFGKEILALCDATVVLVVDGVRDNVPRYQNPLFVTGNTVILKTAANEFIVLAHFKQHSIMVKEGEAIKQGDVLGLCGNSGNSSEPHLHLHLQNVEDMNIATGVKCYFSKLFVNGKEKHDYSPVKGDVIKN